MITKWQDINITGAGIFINTEHQYNNQYVHGSVNLGGVPYTITSAVPVTGLEHLYFYSATLTNGSVSFHGTSVPDEYLSKRYLVHSRYDGTAWQNYILPDFSQTNIIKSTHIIDLAITTTKINNLAVTLGKMANLAAAGSMIYGGIAGVCTDLAIGTASYILQVNAGATAPAWIQMTGDVTIAVGGVTTISALAVHATMLNTDVLGNGLENTAGAGTAIKVKVTAGTSLSVTANGIELTNEVATPPLGAGYFYGYNGAARGWYLSSAYSTLQTCFDNVAGHTITIANGTNHGVVITNNDTTHTPNLLTLINTAASASLQITQNNSNAIISIVSNINGCITTTNSLSILNTFSTGVAGQHISIVAGQTGQASNDSTCLYSGFKSYHSFAVNSVHGAIGYDSLLIGIFNQATTLYYAYLFRPIVTLNHATAQIRGFYYDGTSIIHTDGYEYGNLIEFKALVAGVQQGINVTFDGASTGSRYGMYATGIYSYGIYLTGTCNTDIRLSNGALIQNNSATQLTITETTTIFSENIQNSGTIVFNGTTTSSGAGVVAITGAIHEVTATGVGDALTLANGAEGQVLRIVLVADGGGANTAIITPTNLAGTDTTITLSDTGDAVTVLFTSGTWFVTGVYGAIIG
ncbi:hypothetical protein CCP3SC1AL1_310009 [Gammaproteobacteria bacterium]